ncbi:DUF3285 domain-containing protein [Prochlorococcus sp. MIT 1300]|uniref:DUF3285 domain-containing protein n=1 Tax=Prochlorococcus sp. MIT 1300 TaxID=3096218 RepID=UPI002A764724|nr:DUF3285 domain-containing protein [Prochlorococcus sp. MIT 1300]
MEQNSSKETSPKAASPSPSFVKLAMRNMVRKGQQSISHFALTAIGFGLFILVIAWFGRPNFP